MEMNVSVLMIGSLFYSKQFLKQKYQTFFGSSFLDVRICHLCLSYIIGWTKQDI